MPLQSGCYGRVVGEARRTPLEWRQEQRARGRRRRGKPRRLKEEAEGITDDLHECVPRFVELGLPLDRYSPCVIVALPFGAVKGKFQLALAVLGWRLACSYLLDGRTLTCSLLRAEVAFDAMEDELQFPYRPVPYTTPYVACGAVRLEWRLSGVTLWGRMLTVHSSDVLRLDAAGKVYAHECSWQEDPAEVADRALPEGFPGAREMAREIDEKRPFFVQLAWLRRAGFILGHAKVLLVVLAILLASSLSLLFVAAYFLLS